jgi:hypothetical protein
LLLADLQRSKFMKRIFVLYFASLAVCLADAELLVRNNANGTVFLNSDVAQYGLPLGESRLQIPFGDYELSANPFDSNRVSVSFPDTAFGGYMLRVATDTNGVPPFYLQVEETQSPLVWFGEGFGLALLFFGFGLVLRIQRGVVNHSAEL